MDLESQRYFRQEYWPTATLYQFLCQFSKHLSEMQLDGIEITQTVLEVRLVELFSLNREYDRALLSTHPKDLDAGYFFPDNLTQTDQTMITRVFYKRKNYEI